MARAIAQESAAASHTTLGWIGAPIDWRSSSQLSRDQRRKSYFISNLWIASPRHLSSIRRTFEDDELTDGLEGIFDLVQSTLWREGGPEGWETMMTFLIWWIAQTRGRGIGQQGGRAGDGTWQQVRSGVQAKHRGGSSEGSERRQGDGIVRGANGQYSIERRARLLRCAMLMDRLTFSDRNVEPS